MVRLKAEIKFLQDGEEVDFNSTMVRLKVDILTVTDQLKTTFQFHYGTIKSFLSKPGFIIINYISIPLWYD